MRRASAGTLVGIASLVLVLYLVNQDLERTSPGPLASVHARETDLAGGKGCDRCHGQDGGTMADACFDCHAEIGRDIEAGEGLHGSLIDSTLAETCRTCHLEHHGDDVAPITARSFALAGIEDSTQFDHTLLGYQLEGTHKELACTDCHNWAEIPILPKDATRFMGLDRDCSTCHDDPHEGAMARECADCHGQEGAFEELTAFRHDRGLALDGAHGGLECADCHSGEYSVEAVAGHDPPPERTCEACHDSPHSSAFQSAFAAAGTASPEDGCAECHSNEAWVPASLDPDQHARTGFPLEVPHDDLECEECHDSTLTFDLRFPGRVADDCAACHDDPHAGQFAGRPRSSCIDCHSQDGFLPCTFGLESHAETAFALVGAHVETACEECHKGDPAIFVGTPSECSACHADAHRGAFATVSCAQCHDAQSFACSRFEDDPSLHERWAGFALDGAHLTAACEACHPRSATADPRTGRSLGFVADQVDGDPRACASCHSDPHLGVFSEATCDECHHTESFADVGAFDHSETGFGLDGAHAQTACARCHPPLQEPEADGRSFAHARDHFGGSACADCHTDAHRGEFGSDCARCHDTISFRRLPRGFEHGVETSFALEGAHAQASCSACHAARLVPDARGRTYEQALGTGCADCHADPHAGQFQKRSCDECHGTTRVWSADRFDHDRSRFHLDGEHRDLACAACHRQWPLPGGGRAVRYRPLGTSCKDCHGFGDGESR